MHGICAFRLAHSRGMETAFRNCYDIGAETHTTTPAALSRRIYNMGTEECEWNNRVTQKGCLSRSLEKTEKSSIILENT